LRNAIADVSGRPDDKVAPSEPWRLR
jgi:hypothetical protein